MHRTCSHCSIRFHYKAATNVALGACPSCETLQLLPAQETFPEPEAQKRGSFGPSLVHLETSPTTSSLLLGILAILTGGSVLAVIALTYAGHLVALLGMGDPISAAPGIAVMLGTLIAWMVLHAQGTWTSMAFLILSGVAGGWLLRLGLRELAPMRALLALRRMRHAPAISLLPSRS